MSEERFLSYLMANHSSEIAACQRYAWNTAVSAAFYGPIQALEVTLRNAVHDAIRSARTDSWYDSSVVLLHRERLVVREAKEVKSQRVVYEIVRCNDSRVNPFSDR